MFSLVVLALAVASAGAHSFSPVRRHHVPRTLPPKGWQTGYLEDYNKYHTRYEAIGCGNKHGTTFFDSCCHPLLAGETVAKNREPCCAVGATVACRNSAPAPAKTSPAKASPAKTSPAKASSAKPNSAAAPAKTTAAENGDEDCDEDDGDDDDDSCNGDYCDDDNDNDDDGEDCEDEGDEPSSTYAAPTSTKVAPKTSSHAGAPTTTSTHTTPKETTTAKAEPPTYTTPKATPTPTTSASTSPGDKSSSGSFIFGGFGTWFLQGGQEGACGKLHKDTDFVVALETKTYANGIHCGRGIQICDTKNNKCVNGIVADECPTCTNPQSVDMSRSMFEGLAALSVGEFSIKWAFT